MSYKAMSLLVVLAAGAVSTYAVAGYSNASVVEVGRRDVPYKISDGARTEVGQVRYRGYLDVTVTQTGDVSTIFHPIDDRECKWTIAGQIDRIVCVQSLMGAESCSNKFSKTTPVNLPGSSNGLKSWFDHDPCTDYAARINNDINTAKAQLSSQFQALTDADLKGDLRSTMQGASVTITYGSPQLVAVPAAVPQAVLALPATPMK